MRNREFMAGIVAGAAATSIFWWLSRKRGRNEDGDHAGDDQAPTMSKAEILAIRKRHFCKAQSISYENSDPLLVVRGRGQYLYDEHGTRYLDTRNNVGHVGWQHPAVVAAVARQLALTNSNARYLHPALARLARRLCATLPDRLCVCVFVNSGSEANDLALRMARVYAAQQQQAANAGGGARESEQHVTAGDASAGDVIVVDRAYHGHTCALINVSPYKYEHAPGGVGRRPWVRKVPCPDTYRGAHAGAADAARLYSDYVGRACADARRAGRRVAAMFVESGMSVAGVILPPPGYLQRCFAHVRAAGGLCIADEVQTGFGRIGDHFWAFQQQGPDCVPDVVTCGKPFGNGVPLAALVCTRAVADAFHNGVEYFNTFGGNPVSAAAGLAVLDVLAREGLQARAKDVGAYLRARLATLAAALAAELGDAAANDAGARAPVLIGDVRGSGLFVGIEFVTSVETRVPATAGASVLCSRLKDAHRILTSIDGAHDNVLVVKPPMCFSRANVDTFVGAMRDALRGITADDVANYKHTPT